MISHLGSPPGRVAPPRTLALTELTGERAFLELKEEWNRLVEEDPRATVFQTWEMQYHLWRCFADRISPVILTVRNETGRLAALAPLGASLPRVGGLPVRVLGFAAPRYADYAGFLVRPDRSEESLALLARWLRVARERWDVIRLGPLREDGWLLDDSQRFLHLLADGARAERVDTALSLRVGNRTPEQARRGSLDREVRRLFRRTGGRFQEVPAGPALGDALRDLYAFHQTRMHSHNELGVFGDSRVQDEFTSLVGALHERGVARVHRVETGGATVAVTCTFEFRGTVSFYQSGFDAAFGRLGPGKILRALRIEEALRDGAGECDFLRGDEPYKLLHATDRRALYAIEIPTGSWRRIPYERWRHLRSRLSESRLARAVYLGLRPRKSRPEILTA